MMMMVLLLKAIDVLFLLPTLQAVPLTSSVITIYLQKRHRDILHLSRKIILSFVSHIFVFIGVYEQHKHNIIFYMPGNSNSCMLYSITACSNLISSCIKSTFLYPLCGEGVVERYARNEYSDSDAVYLMFR